MSAVHRESYERHINSTIWKRIREAALARDQYRCVQCGSRYQLQIHHVTYKRFGSESLNDVQTLCQQCHRVADKQRRQKETTMIDTIQQQQWILETTGHVYQTTDYDLFHRIRENRTVKEQRVLALMAEIERKNLLPSNPIKVTRDYGILDGQHRHEAARRLRLPIFYFLAQVEMTVDDVATENAVTSKWTLDDYLDRFVQSGSSEYLKLADFVARAKDAGIQVGLSSAIEICSYANGNDVRRDFKNGLFQANDMEFADRVLSRLIDWRVYTSLASANTPFHRAIANLESQSGYDHKRMMAKVKLVPTRVMKCASVEDYLVMFSDIYNFKVRAGAEVHLRKMNANNPNWRVDREQAAA